MLFAVLLATNRASSDGAMAIAAGPPPVPTLSPFAVSTPLFRFTTKEEIVVLASAVTKRRPAPALFSAVLVPQEIKDNANTGRSRIGRKRNFIPILSPTRRFKISRLGQESSRHMLGDQG